MLLKEAKEGQRLNKHVKIETIILLYRDVVNNYMTNQFNIYFLKPKMFMKRLQKTSVVVLLH